MRRYTNTAGRSEIRDVHPLMNLLDLVVGKPIKTSDERAEQIGPAQGIPIFGLDGLSSAAYGPEAALSLLIPLGLIGAQYIVPITAAIVTLLVIVYFSYRQTIAAYPSGGGSYTVARFNLGPPASLLAAAALLADYILTAAVGISAGVAVHGTLRDSLMRAARILLRVTDRPSVYYSRPGSRRHFLQVGDKAAKWNAERLHVMG
jgi:hypothetical protein